MLLKKRIQPVSVPVCLPDNTTSSQAVFPDDFLSDNTQFLLLYFYPGDFTTICTTELLAFHDKLDAFTDLGVCVVGCSTNGPEVHAAWKTTPKSAGGLGTQINHCLISDVNRSLSRSFDVLIANRNVATRGWFILDKDGVIVYESRHDTKVARDVSEIISTVKDIRKICADIPKGPRNYSTDSSQMSPQLI
jgi:peroxiredoxin (alkyl hydroperoxide reductase subunit C)